jgi:CHASE2 domain-containing sensor protein
MAARNGSAKPAHEKLARAHEIVAMTARHKKKKQDHSAAQSHVSRVSPEEKRHDLRRESWISFWMSVAFTVVLLLANTWFEQKGFGERVESMTYDMLQNRLSAPASIKDLPVIVLDISRIEMRPTLGPQPGFVTDREPLKNIVAEQVKDGPKAIGLDVDFSPDSHGYAHPDDPRLFKSWLASKDIPILVGVNSSLALGAQKWLIDPDYIRLAACVVVPNPEKGQATRYMPEFIKVDYPDTPLGGVEETCPSMGVALAKATVNPPPTWAKYFVETFRLKSANRFKNSEFLVDYSPLQLLHDSAPQVLNSSDIPADLVKDKIVLLGRAKNTTDTFTVPGKPEEPYAGVFLHACAVYTLKNGPLYRFKDFVRYSLDLVISLAIFGPLLWIRLRRLKQGKEVILGHRLPSYASLFVAVIVCIVAVYFVNRTHLMWDDFILVALALVVHTPIEKNTVEFGEWLIATLRSWRHVPAPSTRSHSEGEG